MFNLWVMCERESAFHVGKIRIFPVSTFDGDGVGNGMECLPFILVIINLKYFLVPKSRMFSIL